MANRTEMLVGKKTNSSKVVCNYVLAAIPPACLPAVTAPYVSCHQLKVPARLPALSVIYYFLFPARQRKLLVLPSFAH
jgi:hypothetical protein